MNSQVTTSTIRHDATNTHTIVSNVRNDAANTRATISDAHRNTLKNPEETHGQDRAVSTIRTLLVTEELLNTS